ncbi:hypothetical protein [Streptomyces sp. XD-27]|uniref:SCO2584 family spore wall biosynthesis protein n=1 Tax=Streptomyces sp. XD-27 TaxID=3062779 RepID=UPI0026F4222A|nr:hypothetical protein [Streptomyces sp. XD-27]WKX70299.1 hypothetical protein Q3Y56_10530 [Streptomyces sp. XD-27]
MPDDVGGRPFPDGDEPDERSHGDAEDAFAAVVFDEEFVRSAEIHEPTATERMLAAAQARADAEASRRRHGAAEDEFYDDGYGPDGEFGYDPEDDRDVDERFGLARDHDFGPYGRYGSAGRPYRGHVRWHRPVAWLLAVLMGIGVVALAFTAVYRGASGGRQDPAPPPATTGVDSGRDGDRESPLPAAPAGSPAASRATAASGAP